ncbi:fibrocystin-L-like [Dreissena polymorpha]|nr:fibrocystin-L-like [Dreissena polymorpha]
MQIMCYTPNGMQEENYYVRVVVHGQAVPDGFLCNGRPTSSSCTYKPRASETPTVDSLSPHSGMPGTLVTMTGKLISDRYGSNLASATNGRSTKLLRVYVGPQDCQLKEGDNFFGLALNGEDTDHGSLTCKYKGTSVGFYNASFILEAPFGRSLANAQVYRVSYNDQLYMYQSYTNITSISHSSGSTAGGLVLTIHGSHFDNRLPYVQPRAYIGDTVCEVTNVEVDQYVECRVAADPGNMATKFSGNRGINFEYWTGTSKANADIDSILTMTSSDANYNAEWLDETYFYDAQARDNYVSRMTMFFTAPHSGEYSFWLHADDAARLFVDGVSEVTSLNSWRESRRMTLSQGQKYLLQVVHIESLGDSFIHLNVKYFGTNFTSAWTGKAEQEKQTISITSTVAYDVQQLEFSDFANQSHVQEVQTLVITAGDGEFRIGLFGVYTEPLSLDMVDTDISAALSKLPCFGSQESVLVTRQQTEVPTYTLQFISKRGDFPNVTLLEVNMNSSLEYSVSEDTKGEPDVKSVALTFDGTVSEPFSISDLSLSLINGVVTRMFEGKCPKAFEGPGKAAFYESFETGSGQYSGQVTRESEPFCGRYSLKNPYRIFKVAADKPGIMLSQFGKLCLAYKGFLQQYVGVVISLRKASDGQMANYTKYYEHTFKTDSDQESTTWYYTCKDIYALVHDQYPADIEHAVREVFVYSQSPHKPAYVDAVYIGREEITSDEDAHFQRLPPAMPNGAVIGEVTVTEVTPSKFEVTMKPYKCGFDFPLIELANAQVTAGNMSKGSSMATMQLSNSGGPGVFKVTRSSQASPPVTGEIAVTFKGNSRTGLNVSLGEYEFQRELESVNGIGSLNVNKQGTCAKFDLIVTFLSLAGDQPEMTVTYGNLNGVDAAGTMTTNTNGGLNYDPLMGDLVSTVHSDPQVRLYINDMPTKCGGDCSFNWDTSSTPTVTGASPSSGTSALSTALTVTGTGFIPTAGKNKVTIVGIECTVTMATATSITCNVGNGPVGAHPIIVNVEGKGIARGLVEFTYTANITGISPTIGGLGGGIILTIAGYGFTNNSDVTVNGATCEVQSVVPDEILCILPNSVTAGTFDVEVTQGTTLTHSGFTYNLTLTPEVLSITPSTLSGQRGTLMISGSKFGPSQGTVYLADQEATVISWSDTDIAIDVEVTVAGDLPLLIMIDTGLAVNSSNNIPQVTVDLRITNVFPLQGSIQGGTTLTITGSGFGTNDSLIEVNVGDLQCDVTSVTNTQVLCDIEQGGSIHRITNKGTSPAFGVFYAFDEPFITIQVGDFVHWSWETPAFVSNVAHAIIQVDTPSSIVAKPGGFSSGTPTKNGNFQYQFTLAGTYYVWSGFVDEWGIKNYVGTIEVVPAVPRLVQVNMTLNGVSALHDKNGASNPTDSSDCQSITSAKTACTDSVPSRDAEKFDFAFLPCSTPVVQSVDVNNGTVQTAITITGEGFSTINCQNEVKFGGYDCVVISSNESDIVCQMSKDAAPELAVYHQLSLRVKNRGKALIALTSDVNRGFALLPNIESVSPTSGSMAGGALLTITGAGFLENLYVTIDGYQCQIVEYSYSEIICKTPASVTQAQKDIKVEINAGQPLLAECQTADAICRYSYATIWTPTAEAITPNAMSATTTFTISGTKFGTNVSAIEVTIGGEIVNVESVEDANIIVSIDHIPAGENDVVVRVMQHGEAQGSLTVTGTPVVSTVIPSVGSIHGNTRISISGSGFVHGSTEVLLDGVACEIVTISLAEVVCTTPAHTAATVNVAVTSNGQSFPTASFAYSTSSTPTIASISPVMGLPGDSLVISGSNLDGSSVDVMLGPTECTIISKSASQITCTVGTHETGSVPVSVFVEGLGSSNSNITFQFQLTLTSALPTTGGTAGGQSLVLTGTGFSESASVTVCGVTCPRITSTTTQFTCRTPPNTAQTCGISITFNGLSKTLPSSYTYDASLTPTISGVTPRRGGTGGGVNITISGSGFGSSVPATSVSIDGAACTPTSVSDTQIQCQTGAHSGSVDSKVEVQISGNGIAEESSAGDADFTYIDVWSSPFSWGGGPLPQTGEFVVIPAGQTLLLDTDTPVLAFLLIRGGKLIFDNKKMELQSQVIMITDGGLLQVGTEEEPFQHKAIITLHGHSRNKELPIYGTKVLAVRNGTLDLHGIEVPLTWTRLASTANAGANSITLMHPVEWNVGDEIVIASTGHRHTQRENEKRTIHSVSGDKQTLTLTEALEYEHVSTQEMFDGTLVEFRAEVGLLTHNVVVRGNEDPQWQEEIKACPAGFDTGEFAVQTCFQGRFGDEIGSSQFGAMILVHAPVIDTHEAKARLSYVEVYFAGQAFRLGRYPVHFHMNGDMSTSYVRGLGIHKTFNRAVNIHGTHNTMVEKNVIFDVMGGAMFLEDGVETGNTFQYNLAVFVRESSSLLNDDVTPASFWVTNPNNTIQHNAAAGGTHFGYWYRMHSHPDGPSFTTSVCPQNTELGIFYNNSAHSFGWFGLWVFEHYFPKKGGCGGTEVAPAVFERFFSWNNDKGAEAVNVGALQFKDFVLVQNRLAGYEGKLISGLPGYGESSSMVKDSLIVGTTTVIPNDEQGCTSGGVVFPYGRGFRLVNVRFVNFADSSCAAMRWTRITGTCSFLCGGFIYHTEALKFVNAPNKAIYAWDWEGIILDKDGTATGKAAGNWTILPTTGTVPSDCENTAAFSIGQPASMCPPQHKWHRYAFKDPLPKSLEGKNFTIENQYGITQVQFAKKRITHKPGWMCALLSKASYKFSFQNGEQIKNISWVGRFDDLEGEDYIVTRTAMAQLPDRLSIDGGNSFINMTVGLNPATAKHGDWEWDNDNDEIKFVVHAQKRSRRAVDLAQAERSVSFTAFKCYYANCIPPPDPNTVPPATVRPAEFDYWDDTTIWNTTDDGYLVNIGGNAGIPQDFDNVKIAFERWMIVNITSIIKLGTLLLEGVLEFYSMPDAVYQIEADFIIIRGGRLIIGWPDEPFQGLATITLRGNHSSPTFDAGTGPALGSKAIGVFGGLDLFGKEVGTTWTQLALTAEAGEDTIMLAQPVEWSVGDNIVIGPTSYNPWETEAFQITSVADNNMNLTLNDTLKYRHVAHYELLNSGHEIDVGAGVGLLSHNIKVIGEDYEDMYEESFGARILVGLVVHEGRSYSGYARLSNVEFYHTGQEGFTEEYDPRFSVAYVAVGTVSNVKPSKVTKCSFHNGFNTAVGAFGIGGLDISENVVYGTVGNGLATSSDDTSILNNFITLVIATASYQDRFEEFNPRWEAGIEASDAQDLVLQGNLVSGAERLAYHVKPVSCNDTSGRYQNNKAFANLLGVVVLPADELPEDAVDCVMLSNFTVWKSHDIGIYYQNSLSYKAVGNVLIENTNGLFSIINGPSASSHAFENKRINVEENLFVGQTSSFNCSIDVTPPVDANIVLSENARATRAPGGGMIGFVFPQMLSAPNGAPLKPFTGIKSYNAIGGLLVAKKNTFAKYGNLGCTSEGNFAIATSQSNDDGQHPVEISESQMEDIKEDNKIIIHRPNIGLINSADCVDMDCDALKKALFKDLDGTFLGSVGSVISQSEFEWNGDPRRGLGDYRIPKEMVTRLDGSRIPYDLMMPNKGILRNNNCTYRPSWQSYQCENDIDHEMLIIESMDSDTETRRLSPVAVLGKGYIDLINGPQDHGWCSGYTCRKRLSTFMAIVATGEDFLMHFTSTTPEKMRYRLLNVGPNEGVKLTVWYSRPNRLDLFVDGVYKMATNAHIDGNGRYIIKMPTGNEYEPMIVNGTGTNFFDKDRGELTFIIQGPQRIDVVSQQTVIVSFSIPALTVEEFYFGANIIENIAAFLNIPLTKVRIVNVVSASSANGRRKRSSDGIIVEFEIGNEPVTNINDTAPDGITYENLLAFTTALVNECQLGNVSQTLNVSGSCESIQLPSTDPAIGTIVYNTPTPDHLFFQTSLKATYEGALLSRQPRIQVATINDIVITELGTTQSPWTMEVSIRPGTGHPNAQLLGTLNVTAENGWFNFSDLAITHMGSDYVLDFKIISPVEAENFSLAAEEFSVAAKPLEVHVVSMTAGTIVEDVPFDVTLGLRDEVSGDLLQDLYWRDHQWTVEVSMLATSQYTDLEGAMATTFDPFSGQASFPNLTMTGFGVYYLQFRVVSDPADFDLTLDLKLEVMSANHAGVTPEDDKEVKVKFEADFKTVLPTEAKQREFEQMILNEFAHMWPDVMLSSGNVYEGSIVVSFVIAGNVSTINTTAYALCESIHNKTEYSFNGNNLELAPYLTVNGETLYGVKCGEIPESPVKESMAPWLIAVIVLSCLVAIAIVVVLVWVCCIKPKNKTNDVFKGTLYPSGKPEENTLFKDDTFTSMDFSKGTPPSATNLTPLTSDQRPLSAFSLNMPGPEQPMPAKTAFQGFHGYMATLSPPPSANGSALYLDPREHSAVSRRRSPSPSRGSGSPMLHGSSPSDGGSPLPPVGRDLYHGDYITSPMPRSVSPHLPSPSPVPSPVPSLKGMVKVSPAPIRTRDFIY